MPLLPLIPAALQGVLGLGQTIFSGKKKTEQALEKYTDSYKPNSSIMDFYQKAYNNYSANPYDSKAYTNRSNMIQRNLATGLNAAQDRRSGVGSIGSLVQQANDANAQAAGQAEGQQRANLGMLGQASGMKAQEDFKPFEMKYNLLAAKAGGANANRSAGIQNIFGALGSASNYLTAKEMYGTKKPEDTEEETLTERTYGGIPNMPTRGTRSLFGRIR